MTKEHTLWVEKYRPTTLEDFVGNENLKVSITDIRYSNEPSDPWGTFGLMLRKASDNDDAPQVIESFSNLDLNPASPNYIARRIGDAYARWDDTDRRYRYFGKYAKI